MHTAQFTGTVRAIQNINPTMDVYTLIATATEVCRVHDMPVVESEVTGHEYNVSMALRSEEILDSLRASRKIVAIKELRYLASCGLKEAKDAVEDVRVLRAAGVA